MAVPSDIIIRFHYHATKEAILWYNRNHKLPYQGKTLSLFQDVASSTLQRRLDWRPLADLLCQHEIHFTWGHPFKIVAFKAGRTYAYSPGRDPLKFLQDLSITPLQDFALPGPARQGLMELPRDWYTITAAANQEAA
ncbi:Hypothetical predicted protein [Pelobates cultripes]|uniref:Uncharacterized protein n=1 Tax=Pelobates cultripes TaxID=61616 RepID=A0AAD1RGR5_PELCU|nr:Hypothetical predicted protein [Pelobates cultripes]